MSESTDPNELETAIGAVYAGPLDEFVSRRDALVRQLRAAKRREDADRVKSLRKPSRTAWVLDSLVHEDAASIEQLASAIHEATTLAATDVRAAVETIRGAVRNVAAEGARIAMRVGHPVDANTLVNAVYAVIGESPAFSDLRAGRLVDVPEGGGLDILTSITAIAPAAKPQTASPAPAHTEDDASIKAERVAKERTTQTQESDEPDTERAKQEAERAHQEAERAKAARAELDRAEASLESVRERLQEARRLVQDAQQQLDAADRAVLQAQAEAQARRADLERANRHVETVTARVHEAEQALAKARGDV